MPIDFERIVKTAGRDYKIMAVQEEIANTGFENITITECLANKDRDGLMVLLALDNYASRNESLLRYKIRVLKDRWGNPVKPGDKVEWKFERRLKDMLGRKITNRKAKEMRRRGQGDQVDIMHSATVDAKGCIDVPYADARLLLDTRGVHYETGFPLNDMMKEVDKHVTRDIYDKDFAKPIGRQHYWLYSEAPPKVYKKLPKLDKPATEVAPQLTETKDEFRTDRPSDS